MVPQFLPLLVSVKKMICFQTSLIFHSWKLHRKFGAINRLNQEPLMDPTLFAVWETSTSVQLELKDANSIGVFRNLVEVYCILIFGRMVIFVPTLGPMKNEDSNEVFVFFFFWLIRFQLVVSRSCAAGFQHLRQSRKSPNFCIEKNSGVTVFSGRFFQGLPKEQIDFLCGVLDPFVFCWWRPKRVQTLRISGRETSEMDQKWMKPKWCYM